MNVLVVEDEKVISNFIAKGLREEGHAVTQCADGRAALDSLANGRFDFVILDVMVPGLNGLEICRRERAKGSRIPIIMVTAKSTVDNRIDGLDAGADDYMVKPFSFAELLARMRAVVRRREGEPHPALEVGGLQMDLIRHKVLFDGREIDLTNREFALLEGFMRRPGHVVSRTMIIESVWGYDFQAGTNIIDVYIAFLRRKLRKATSREWIRTIRNRGYVFDNPEG